MVSVPWHKDALKFMAIITVSSVVSSLIVLAIERVAVAKLQAEVASLKYQVASLKSNTGSYR